MKLNKPAFASTAAIIIAAAVVVVAGCKGKQAAPPPGGFQTGIASWYGKEFDGRPTASGEVFDMQKLTAAHRTLPLGAVVRVENLSNHQKVQVKINDRGPFVADRIIDLSYAAAQAISISGIANVRLTIVSTPPTRGVDVYSIQVGNFSDRSQLGPLRQELMQKYGTARVIFRGRDQSWRILVGVFATKESANVVASELNQSYGPAFVVLMDEEN
jgi:rare lipoprotein A